MTNDKKIYSYSSAGMDVLGNGSKYTVNEMVESATSQGMQHQKKTIVEGLTSNIDSDFAKDIVQDGLHAGLGYFGGQVMMLQDKALEAIYAKGVVKIGAWYSKSLIKDKLSGLKGRKLKNLAKFFSDSDKKAEESRLIADFVKMDMDSSSNTGNPLVRLEQGKVKYIHDSLEVQKEGVRADLATIEINGKRDTFDLKLKTSSFTNLDKKLIRDFTGMPKVTKTDIAKLNAMSNSQVFQDSEGNWIGGNQAMVMLTNMLGLHRAS